MRFDQTKQIFGFKKTNVDKTQIDFGLKTQVKTGSLESDGSASGELPATDNAPVEYRAQDKRSFEELVRDQIQLHEANAAASATPVKGSTASMAQVLEAVDLAETCAEVDEAFGQLDGIIIEEERREDERRQSVVDARSEDKIVRESQVDTEDFQLGNTGNAVADEDGAVDVDLDDERDTLKPPRPVEGIKIKMLDSRPPESTPESASESVAEDDDGDWDEVSLDDLVELTDRQPPSDSLVDVMAARSIRDDVPRSRNKDDEVSSIKSTVTRGQQRNVGSFERTSERTSLTGAPASDDELQIVRTSFPPPVSQELRRSHNPWKVVALAALFVLAVMLGWNLKSQSNGFFNNAFSDFPGGRFTGETQESQPHFAQTSISGGEQLAVVSERGNDMTAAINLTQGLPTEIDSAENLGTQWRRRDVENPRKKRNRSANSDRRGDMYRKDNGTADASDQIASVIPKENGAAEVVRRNADKASENDEPAIKSAIPELPSKSDVRDAMTEIKPMIKSCRIDASGKLVLKMIVSGASGKIISSEVVDEKFRGTSTGRCAVRAAQKARLPIFQKKKLTIKYPFNI